MTRATLVVVGGLPATGKTTVASALARARRAVFVRIDTIEQTIVDQTVLAQPLGPVGYEVAYATARQQLHLGLDVVAECVNPLRVTREAWRRVGTDAGADVVDVEIICSDPDEHRRRAETRSVDVPGLVLPSWEQILDREYEPWDRPRVVLDTAVLAVQDAVNAVNEQAPPAWPAHVTSGTSGERLPPVLVGGRSRLRPWRATDRAALHAACQDLEIRRWTRVPSPYYEEDAQEFLDRRVPDTHARGGAAFCVERLDTGQLAGSMALLHLADGVGEIGYWTASWARGQGLTLDALEVLCRWCFEQRAADRLELLIEPENYPSRAVAARAGFTEEGVLRRRLTLDGHRRDVVMYALLALDPCSPPA